ncbi:MAG: tail fiber protein, partial [Bacteroidota bacterium]
MKNITKYTLAFLIFHFSFFIVKAQVSINTDNTEPDASAMLDVSSTDRGMLIPRMDSDSRNSITNPAKGLMVFDSTTNSFWYYADVWQEVGGAFNSKDGLTSSLSNEDDFVFGADSLNYGNSTESKFFFDKDRGAFRTGEINNNNWNTDSLGFSSFAAGTGTKATATAATALGEKTIASGLAATAMGTETIASGFAATTFGNKTVASGTYASAFGIETSASGAYATAFGERTSAESTAATAFGSFSIASGFIATAFGLGTEASGDYATVFGESTIASGNYATAFGGSSLASGDYTTVFGRSTTAPSYGETVVGVNNTTYTPASATGFDENDRLLVVGNGTTANARSDALRIYKNGDAELNGALTIDSSYTLPVTDGTTGQLLQTDGSGNVSWTNVSPIGTIQMWPTETAPSGWLLCDGSTFNTSTYPDLNSVLGGNTLPDFRGRFPLGQYSNSDSQNLSGLTRRNIGDQAGAETHTLTINEMPAHSHSITFGE